MECIIKIPPITYNGSLVFKETDPAKLELLLKEEKRQDDAQRSAWEKIITDKRFIAFSYTQMCEWPITLILHPSTRPNIDWQLTRIDWDGIPNGHNNFFYSKLEPLLIELMSYGRDGGNVRVIYEDE